VLEQRAVELADDRHGTARRLRLRRSDLLRAVAVCLADVELARVKVDFLPVERAQFPEPQAGTTIAELAEEFGTPWLTARRWAKTDRR
jgi:hypothetical protein